MRLIGKITAKVVLGPNLKAIPEDVGRVEAIRVQGRVDRVKVSPSALNPENIDVKLGGEFIATNCLTGEVFSSKTLYPMGMAMVEMMATAEVGSMFAVRIFLCHSKKTIQGYCFDFESALDMKPSDAVRDLGNAFLALGVTPEDTGSPIIDDTDEKHGVHGGEGATTKKSKK